VKSKIFQQGDVVFETAGIPSGLERSLDPIVQHGEATGHAHRLQMFRHEAQAVTGGAIPQGDCPQWMLFKDKNSGKRFLKVEEPTDLTHEEHKTVTIPPGEYEIRIVQEYDHFAEETRQVQD
jgi:hypothetical protein